MENSQESLWFSGCHRICDTDDGLKIPVQYALLSIATFFLEQNLKIFKVGHLFF